MVTASAPLPPLVTLKKRSEYLRIRGGQRWNGPAFLIEAKARVPADVAAARFGFTVTKKLGGAVVRNRMRRRLKEAVRRVQGQSGFDYVIVARPAAVDRVFTDLVADFEAAIKRVHKSPQGERNRKGNRNA